MQINLDSAVEQQYLKAFKLIVSVHDQLRFVSIYSDQDDIVWTAVHVAAHQLVGGSISEELEEEEITSGLTQSLLLYSTTVAQQCFPSGISQSYQLSLSQHQP